MGTTKKYLENLVILYPLHKQTVAIYSGNFPDSVIPPPLLPTQGYINVLLSLTVRLF